MTAKIDDRLIGDLMDFGSSNPEIVDALTIFAQSQIAIGSQTHPTVAKRGRAYAWADEPGAILFGLNTRGKTIGNTSPTPGSEGFRAFVNWAGKMVRNLAVTGLAGTFADRLLFVYLVDDGTYTTVPGNQVVGFIVEPQSTARATVYFFSFPELVMVQLALGPTAAPDVFLGVISGVAAAARNGLTGLLPRRAGLLVSVYGEVIEPLTGAGASLTVNPEIDGVNVTGGVIPWVLADAAGTKIPGSAITGANALSVASLLDIEIAVTTASTGGLLGVYAVFRPQLGL